MRSLSRISKPALTAGHPTDPPTHPPTSLLPPIVCLKLYNFVWDRFRMIRSDYNMQGYNAVVGLVSEASIVAHERMAR